MLEHFSGFEFSNIVLLVGVLVSANVRRKTNINPGGIVVAPFLILSAVTSLWWTLTLPLVGILIALIYKRFFSHIYLGRQPLFIMAGLSVVCMTTIGFVMTHYKLIPTEDLTFPIGLILPAILAATITKQGVSQTLRYASLTTAITAAIVGLVYLGGLGLGHDFHALDRLIAGREAFQLKGSALLALVSVVIGYVIYRYRRVKAAGFVMLPFLATLCAVSPLSFILLLALVVVVYLATWVMRRFSLLIGVGRFSFVFVVALTAVWTVEYILLHESRSFSPFMGASIYAAVAIAVIVNEQNIFGVRRTVPILAVSISAMLLVELIGAYGLQTISHHPVTIRSLAVAHHHEHGVH